MNDLQMLVPNTQRRIRILLKISPLTAQIRSKAFGNEIQDMCAQMIFNGSPKATLPLSRACPDVKMGEFF